MNAKLVTRFNDSSRWAPATVAKLLQTRAVLGEFQPYRRSPTKTREPDGPPVPNYYPRVVTPDEWEAARFAVEGRTLKRGPVGKHVFLFSGLLIDARDGAPIYQSNKGPKRELSLANGRAMRGHGARYVAFPVTAFEAAILSRLREVDPRDILPELHPDDEAEAPAGDRSERRTLLAVLSEQADATEARHRLRDAIRRSVEGVSCLFVAGAARLAYAQIYFVDGHRRTFVIACSPWGCGRTRVNVVTTIAPAGPPSVDLRTPEGVAHTLAWMEQADISALRPAMEVLYTTSS